MFKKKKRRRMQALIFAILAFITFANLSYASDTFNVGYTSDNTSYWSYAGLSTGSSKVPTGSKLQIIFLPNNVITGPTLSGGIGANETLLSSLNTNGDLMGYDSVGLSYSNVSGHFFHQGKSASEGSRTFIVRVWDSSDPSFSTAKFGESYPFPITFSFSSPDLYYKYFTENILAGLPKESPAVPSPIRSSVTRGSGTTPPSVTLGYTSKIGARFFDWELYRKGDQGNTLYKYNYNGENKDAYHTAYYSDGSSYDRNIYVPLSSGDDNQWYTYRIRSGNSFGTSDWVSGEVFVEENEDPSTPWAITDLAASVSDKSITLTWTAPYDTNKNGQQSNCKLYNIRVSTEAIVSEPVSPFSTSNTNPTSKTSWANAVSIESFFQSSITIPTPESFRTVQTVTIPSVSNLGTYYFAIKAKDADKWSYVSNVAGVTLGSTETFVSTIVPETKSYTFISYYDSTSGGLGINTFTVPFATATSEVEGQKTTLYYLSDLIQEINKQAKKNVVYTFGWWDPIKMKNAGYEIIYTNPSVLNSINEYKATNILQPPTMTPITKDMAYQVSVTANVTFEVKGVR